MNKLTIIGNLTKDPELRTTTTGKDVCSFTVAVNRKMTSQQRQSGEQPAADYFRVSAWGERGTSCGKYLSKGKKVCVVGAVSVDTYTGNDGTTRASLEIKFADEVEFLSPAGQVSQPVERKDEQSNMTIVDDPDDLPF